MRWIASALGKFVYKLRNATKGITRICKVNNGAVAICNGANRGLRTRYLIHSLSHKKRKHRNFDAFFFGGKRWIRTTEGGANRFTVCSLWPLGNLPIWSWWSESNQQPADYKSAALPLSHTSEVFGTNTLCRTIRIKMVPWGGVEPPTQGFSVPCSTN